MAQRPNVLFMIADDHRFDALHLAGDPVVQTPSLDALAARGVTFRSAHSMGGFTAAVCVPSRACLHTGSNVFRASEGTAIEDMPRLMTMNPALPTFPSLLRDAGYHTYAVGKWHNDKRSFARSFRGGARIFFGGMSDHRRVPIHDFDPTGLYPESARYYTDQFSTEMFADAAIDFLGGYREADPFFLYVAFTSPHDPRTAPPPFSDQYDPSAMPLPENFLPRHPFDNGELEVRDEKLAPMPRTPEVVRQHIADYYAMVSHLDAQVGRILAALDSTGHAEDTIVVYTADHGLSVGQHGLLGKQNLYDHSVRIPMILAGPDLPRGETRSALVHLYDLNPTLCDLTDIRYEGPIDGRSLVPIVEDARASGREAIYAVYKDVQRMVSDGHWKLIRYYRSEQHGVGSDQLQLFNLADDPKETTNLAQDPRAADQLHRLGNLLQSWQRSVGDPLADRPVILR